MNIGFGLREPKSQITLSHVRRGPGAIFLILVALVSQSTYLPVIPQAAAGQSVKYTLTVPFERKFREDGRFRPPVKFSNRENNTVLSRSCKMYLSENPVVNTRTASGRLASKTRMIDAHRFNSATWVKDSNGENFYRFRGTCVFVGRISLNLPASNFYIFDVYEQDGVESARTSYPYTLAQLKSMKEGIREIRRGPGDSLYTFTPVPDIETPKIKLLACYEGSLVVRTEDEEEEFGEKVLIAYFAVTNSIYKLESPNGNHPVLQQMEKRPESTEEFFIEYDFQDLGLWQGDSPVFTTWRKLDEKGFTAKLRSTYSFWNGIDREIAKEKTFTVEISSDCNSASITTS